VNTRCSTGVGCGVAIAILLGASSVRAQLSPQAQGELATAGQLSQKFKIDDLNPEASVPTDRQRDRNPLEFGYFLQDLLDRAEQARKQGDFPAVVLYYRAVAKAVPERAKGWGKLCEAYQIVHDRDRALRACKFAVERAGVELGDYIRYVELLIDRDGDMTAGERTEASKVLDHLTAQPSLELISQQLRCQVGVKAKDVPMLETCTAALIKLAPRDAKTLVFRWSLAVQKGQRQEAERLIEETRKLGVVMEDNIQRMDGLTASLAGTARPTWPMLLLAAAALLVGVGILAVRAVTRRRSLS